MKRAVKALITMTMVSALAIGLGLGTEYLQDRHTVSSDGLSASQAQRDPAIGQLAPSWLRSKVSCPCSVLVLSCTECISEDFLDAALRFGAYVAVPNNVDSGWIKKRWPALKLTSYSYTKNDLNLWFAPRVYKLDKRGSFSYIQSDYTQNIWEVLQK